MRPHLFPCTIHSFTHSLWAQDVQASHCTAVTD